MKRKYYWVADPSDAQYPPSDSPSLSPLSDSSCPKTVIDDAKEGEAQASVTVHMNDKDRELTGKRPTGPLVVLLLLLCRRPFLPLPALSSTPAGSASRTGAVALKLVVMSSNNPMRRYQMLMWNRHALMRLGRPQLCI